MMKKNRSAQPQTENSLQSSRKQKEPLFSKRRIIWTAILLFLLFLLLGILGKVADASGPGDFLFGVDKGYESLRDLFTPNPRTRAAHDLDSFNERQREAEQIVVGRDTNTCDPGQTSIDSDAAASQNAMTALNLSLTELRQAEANLLQITDAKAKEDVAAEQADRVIHHLQIWAAISKFAPKQTESTVVEVADQMSGTLQRALAVLPEGRRKDITVNLPFQGDQVKTKIQAAFTVCDAENQARTAGSRSGQGTGARGTGTQGGSTSRPTQQTGGTGGGTGIGNSGSTGSRPAGGNSPAPGSQGGLNINANTDSGANINVGISEQGQVTIDPKLSPNPQGGTGAEASVNDQKVVDTHACSGAQVLGICL